MTVHDADDSPSAVEAEGHEGDLGGEPVVGMATAGRQVVTIMLLPVAVMLLGVVAGAAKYVDEIRRGESEARVSSVQAASEITVAALSYRPDTVEAELSEAQQLLTGGFRDSYSELIRDVVIPGARERRISAVATVPAAAAVTTTETRAVVVLFVNQTIVVGDEAPTSTASSVRVTLDRHADGPWLIAGFDPL